MVINVKAALAAKIRRTANEMNAPPRSPELPDQHDITSEQNPAVLDLNDARLDVNGLLDSRRLKTQRKLLKNVQCSPCKFNFRDACEVFMVIDVDFHYNIIRSTILGYSLKIYGLPECPTADLFLAVYFFMEEVFGIETKLELCVRLVEKDDQNVVGVVLDSAIVKNQLLEKSNCLEGTDVRISANADAGWVLEGLCGHFGAGFESGLA